MSTMAHLSEVVDGRGHHVDAAGAAGGGHKGEHKGEHKEEHKEELRPQFKQETLIRDRECQQNNLKSSNLLPCLPGLHLESTTSRMTQSSPSLQK